MQLKDKENTKGLEEKSRIILTLSLEPGWFSFVLCSHVFVLTCMHTVVCVESLSCLCKGLALASRYATL